MCTVLLLLRPDGAWPLILGANRDERLDRAFEPPGRYWDEAPGIVAGRDVLGGGSWFGVSDAGVAATIVNGPYRLGPLHGKATRGELVVRALRERDARSAAEMLGAFAPDHYRGFTLLVADRGAAFAVSSDERRIVVDELAPGHHIITPEGCDVPTSPRYAAHIAAFRAAAPPDPGTGEWTTWTEILRHDDEADPHRAITIAPADDFGTVCSTLLALPRDAARAPVLLFANGPPTRAPYAAVEAPRVRGVRVEGSV
jgi:transport and Golgi organization protein 2